MRISQLPDCLTRVCATSPTPCGELNRVNPAIADLRPVDHRVVHPQLNSKLPLRQASVEPHLPEHFAELAVFRFVLRPCCHIRSTVNCRDAAASLAARVACEFVGSAVMAGERKERPTRGRSFVPLEPPIWLEVIEVLGFSPRQARIVELILAGACDKQIAQRLSLSVDTVRTYLKRINTRLGTSGRVELVVRVFSTALEIIERKVSP